MEDKPAGNPAAATPGAEAQPSADAPSSRRRAGGLKRKANSLSTSTSSSSTPSKRMTRDREKAAMSLSLAQIHNGPLTRAARHGPSTFGSSSGGRGAAGGVKLEEKEKVGLAAAMAAAAAEEEERNKLEELGKKIEAEFEAVRSRDSNAHVVPNHCGWFSWTKVHPLEERALSNFFNGKSPDRTPATYMEIRNWIVNKFHTNPNEQIEMKDLSNLEFADLEARQEVLEFLDYWGLINFHPFPQMPDNSENSEDAGTTSDSLLEKLFRFGPVPSCADVAPKPSSSTTSASSGLFPDSTIAEELLQPEGPSVEYHCNSCSADCSRKRYHCQKQADYDLCADCFNNGKFDPDMSSSDFILMEPAEAHGLSGGKWTDQETLLLLEALEIYKENWNEIAEHVATKTKAQCILHFVQMPIEDAFLDSNNVDDTAKEVADTDATNETAPETSNVKTGSKEDQSQTSPMETSKPEDTIEVKDISENGSEEKESAPQVAKSDADEGKEISETPKPDAGDGKTSEDDVALRALTEAFAAVGYAYSPGLSFAEVGNPVMAMAAFFVRLVGGDVVSASARISLKSVSSSSPGLQLAARHCFLLEDPPDTRKEQGDGDCDVAEKTEQHDAPIGNQDDKNESANNGTSDPDVLVSASDLDNDKNKVPSTDKNKSVDSPNDESNEKEKTTEVGLGVSEEGGGANVSKEISVSDQPLDTEEELHEPQPMSESSPEPVKKQESSPVTVKEQEEGSSAVDHPQVKVMGDNVEMVSGAEKVEPSSTSLAGEVLDQAAAEVSKEVGDIVSDAIPVDKDDKQEQVKPSLTVEDKVHTEDIDMTSSQPSEGKNDEKPEEDDEKRISTSIVVEDGATAGEAQKDSSTKEKSYCERSKDGCKIDKLKRAGVAALSAAAVKAKLLADQEEDQIRQLTAALIEKQLQKLEMKLAFFNDMDTVILRVKEQLDRSRQRLYQERAQIIAARLGYPASSSSSKPPAHPALAANRIAMNFANAFPRPPMGLASAQMTPVSRPMGVGGVGNNASSNPFNPTVPVNSVMPSSQDTPLSSVETK